MLAETLSPSVCPSVSPSYHHQRIHTYKHTHEGELVSITATQSSSKSIRCTVTNTPLECGDTHSHRIDGLDALLTVYMTPGYCYVIRNVSIETVRAMRAAVAGPEGGNTL